jgi:hypothetical protein
MGFSVSYDPAAPPCPTEVPTSAGQELGDDYDTLVIEACSALSEAGGSRFHISGFGSDEWPLDVAYDLSAFMEQFASLLAGVRERRDVEVDLYSQGVERTLSFRPVENLVVIHCESRTDWVPNPEYESLVLSELVTMLSKLAEDFARGLKSINSELSRVAPFARWLEGEA